MPVDDADLPELPLANWIDRWFPPLRALPWDHRIARLFCGFIWYCMALLVSHGLVCGLPPCRPGSGCYVWVTYEVPWPIACDNTRVHYGWPVVALVAMLAARCIERGCDALGHGWLTAGGRLRWVALWLVCFYCGARLLSLFW
jgi:hypothetical protein